MNWIIVDAWAPWCGWCLKMHKEVYPVLPDTLAGQFTFSKINYDKPGQRFRYQGGIISGTELLEEFRIETVPAIVFLSPDAEYQFHLSGFIRSEPFKE